MRRLCSCLQNRSVSAFRKVLIKGHTTAARYYCKASVRRSADAGLVIDMGEWRPRPLTGGVQPSHHHVTRITSAWAMPGQESNYRSVRGRASKPQRSSNWDGESLGTTQFLPTVPQTERAAMAKGSVQIVVERCKACGFCVEFCPTHVLALSSAFNAKGYHTPYMVHPDKCSGCDLCGMYCPDFAIFGFKSPEAEAKKAQAQPATEVSATPPAAAESQEVQDAR